MKNIEDLRDELVKVFDGVKKKKIDPEIAKELNTTAGKIISSCKIQLEYQLYQGNPTIKFLEA